MPKSRTDKTIVKFITKEANADELDELEVSLREESVFKTFRNFIEIDFISTFLMTDYDLDKAKKNIRKKILKEESKRNKRIYLNYGIAASILLLFGMFAAKNYFNTTNPSDKPIEIESQALKIGTNKAILTLDDGSQVALEKGKKIQTDQIQSNGEKLVYSAATEAKDKNRAYNYLTIPRGGQYFVQLSDSTKVWLNSDSKLKYPVAFKKGEVRSVELMYGEAYFEVSHSSKHNGSRFMVMSKTQEVEVLGTSFNIMAYDGDNKITTTLVEGKVQVGTEGNKKVLRPDQQSQIDTENGHIHIVDVDSSQEISWIKGLFIFDEEPLQEMMKILSRWYDAEVFYEREETKKFVFTGVLRRTKSIEDVLKFVEASSDGEITFEIKGRVIIIR